MADSDSSTRTEPDEQLTAKELTTIASETVADLTGFSPESVSGLQWDGGTWLVTVEVCEVERIPSTTDVMASYVVQLDERGGIVGYKRTRRYIRSQAEED
jgi:Gas vesicle synthesis protein GvpO